MKIMRYTVSSMQEGMALIRKEMGPDAVIISSKKKREKGILGFFLRHKIEITAAVDSKNLQSAEFDAVCNENKKLVSEINDIKNTMQKIMARQDNKIPKSNDTFSYWADRLTGNDVDKNYVAEIISDIQSVSKGKKMTADILKLLILSKLNKLILTGSPLVDTKYITFVGPTGVGKTTTMAKLAANFAFNYHKKTAMVTIDTYRVGAVEQLRKYADITGLPLEVVYTLEEMDQAMKKFEDYDLVLMDTAGHSAKNTLHIAETSQYIQNIKDCTVYLVVSATTKPRDLQRIADAFNWINYDGLILTKLDETNTFGTVLNLCKITSLPIFYITTGQNVPEDIEAANSSKLAEMVLGED